MKLYKLIFIGLTITLFGCQSKINNNQQSTQIIDTIVRIDTVTYGDSLRIIYKYCGDTVIQNRIDLKGVKDDGFDNSFTVKSIWATKYPVALDCSKKISLSVDSIEFVFCFQDALKYTENKIKKSIEEPWISKGLKKIKQELIAINNNEIDSFSFNTYILVFSWLRNIDCSIYDYKTQSEIKKVRIENYETEFSGGYNFFFISTYNDTIAQFYVNEWIR